TGSIPAAVAAVEAVDECVGRVLEAVARVGGTALVTADHGNAERMLCEDGSPFTAHTTGPVRLILSAPAGQTPATVRDGILADVAPTILHLLQIPQPREMTGTSLVR
ncbi:MAG: 2,3-bisphosphoglycerate-independent phosphoglycerate mutase, partial [Gemmatimonadetes bacterium]|nr:2,3-bisphosphoglycerate-independent phosphoglycerate mutase [Gemmatimonadota bacterium]